MQHRFSDCYRSAHWQKRSEKSDKDAVLHPAGPRPAGTRKAATRRRERWPPPSRRWKMQVEAGNIRLTIANLKSCTSTLSYGHRAVVLPQPVPARRRRPVLLHPARAQPVRELPAGKEKLTVEIPQEFRARNVMVETWPPAPQDPGLLCQHPQSPDGRGLWQLAVTHATPASPFRPAYVKVYIKTKAGEVKFFKDGLHRLAAGVSTAPRSTTKRAGERRPPGLLILSPSWAPSSGKTAPPKR